MNGKEEGAWLSEAAAILHAKVNMGHVVEGEEGLRGSKAGKKKSGALARLIVTAIVN